jgi:alkanesulfonate monooxygenase SsuD/methylene tetrahydromethanopterin reductase-like flavin-dependent oxidoreductase (luciferase family)
MASSSRYGTPDEVIERTREIMRRADAGGLIVVSAFGNLAREVARSVMQALNKTVGHRI